MTTQPAAAAVSSRPQLDGIAEVALYVEDPERSVRFYQDLFGFPVVASGPRLTALAVPGRQVLLLCKKKASLELPHTAHDGEGQLHLAFAIPRAGLAAWEAWLTQKGIPIVERKTWEFGGQSLYFRDPDQHVIELATPGVWSSY